MPVWLCDIRWEDESIAVQVEGAGQSIVFVRWEGIRFSGLYTERKSKYHDELKAGFVS